MKTMLAVIGVIAVLYFLAGRRNDGESFFDRLSYDGERTEESPEYADGPAIDEPQYAPVVVAPSGPRSGPRVEFGSRSVQPVVQRVWVPPAYVIRYTNGRPYRVLVPGHYNPIMRPPQRKEKHFALDLGNLIDSVRR